MRPDGEVRHVEFSATARFVAGRHLAILRDIAGRKRAEGERAELLRREQLRLRETETLLAVSRALGSTLDPTETMRRVAREIALALGADLVGAYLADAARENLWPAAGYHVPPDMLDAFRRIPIPIKNHPAIEEAWAHRRAVWTDDMPADPRVDPDSLRQFPHPSGSRTGRSANRAKDEFLAAIANAAAALERRGAGGEEATTRLRQIIHRQTHHLTRLVDDLLDVARATAGKIPLNRQPLDLSEVAGGCVRSLRASGRARLHRVTFRAESVIVSADPTRLAQIVTNMLDNAVKFTPSGGTVDVDVLREGQEAVLRVSAAARSPLQRGPRAGGAGHGPAPRRDGYGQADDRRRSKEAGFDAHLVKPVSQTLLSSLIAAP